MYTEHTPMDMHTQLYPLKYTYTCATQLHTPCAPKWHPRCWTTGHAEKRTVHAEKRPTIGALLLGAPLRACIVQESKSPAQQSFFFRVPVINIPPPPPPPHPFSRCFWLLTPAPRSTRESPTNWVVLAGHYTNTCTERERERDVYIYM